MKTQNAKAKGRRLQQWVKCKLLKYLPLAPRDVHSTSMGDQGSDVKLSEKAFKLFPYDIECKNQERINIWDAYKQVSKRCDGEPVVVIKRNKANPLVIVDAEYFIKMHAKGKGE